MRHEDLARELESIVGPGHVSVSDDDRRHHAADAYGEPAMPDVVVWPRTTEEVEGILRLANRERVPVTPRAGGVGYTGGAVPLRGGILLSVTRMNRILEIDEANLVAVV